ncbi:MAG: hypothetical protein AAFN93_07200 [Bacteroidota bacterium]
MGKNNQNWKRYAYEFLSIFIAVTSAFALNNWSANRRDSNSEDKILREIKNGLQLDLQDFDGNKKGHAISIRSGQVFRDLVYGRSVAQDSLPLFYVSLFRDYTPIINLSGYESLKSSGLEILKNDDLRFEIITLYDFYYEIISKLEDDIIEMRSFSNYYHQINDLLYKNMVFDDHGRLKEFSQPLNLSEDEKKEMLSYLWRIEHNRVYKLGRYNLIQERMRVLIQHIDEELEK